jgi:hypothetical protein
MHSEGQSMTGLRIIEKDKPFHDEMKITDKLTLPDSWL